MTYELKNKKYAIKVDSLGAELKSFSLNDEEYLYLGDSKYWHRSSPVLFPNVGKLKNNNYIYQNKNYSLPIHGLARHLEFEIKEKTHTCLSFVLKDNEQTLKHYPFSFELTLTYTLEVEGLIINYTVKSDEEILFSLGAHPAFLLKAPIDDSFFSFEKSEHQDAIGLNLDYGCICDVKDFKLSSDVLHLEKNIFSKDALIFKNLNSKNVSLNNTLNKKSVQVAFDGFEYLAFWAPVGAPFVCIEPWCGIADDVNTNHQLEEKISIIKLQKDEVFDKSLFISLV